ncbi:DUF2202 [Desulfonema limicola]|uniref:DUF2202 n=1 Tax=Desulfonema limicola TaxID=45656 RepID=A0A975B5Y8_9BACT|nr:DUF2202 domain-containing protein [Desulfonema limicola]QTA79357.1 DUF2202 [Desulfonema limicola]
MNYIKIIVSVSLLSLIVSGSALAFRGQGKGQQANSAQNGNVCSAASLPYEDISDIESSDMLYMIEEEKLARDVYLAMYEFWNQQVFDKIAQSEQKHMAAISSLLAKYEIDYSLDDTAGIFTNPELQTLYHDLVQSGSSSLAEALRAGAAIEDLDIFDLKSRLEQTDNTDIKTVYENLMKGSENHLRAFVYQLSLLGETYSAQYLSSEEIQAIIDSENERGQYNENKGTGSQNLGKGRKGTCVNL